MPTPAQNDQDAANNRLAYEQAVLNRDNGVLHIVGLLKSGHDRLGAWNATSNAIRNAMSRFEAEATRAFLSDLAAAVGVRLAEQDTAAIEDFPQLKPGVELCKDLLAQGMTTLDVWTVVANRTCNSTHDLPVSVVVWELADLVAAGQVLLAEQEPQS